MIRGVATFSHSWLVIYEGNVIASINSDYKIMVNRKFRSLPHETKEALRSEMKHLVEKIKTAQPPEKQI